ncbi:MAG: PQQ-binding-like beta-propeller repeat protein, partial [Actinobacteria bacterium]|nr:PQQ-binding-like beta-propeller repeat protein [Actinomycetota bacterium]
AVIARREDSSDVSTDVSARDAAACGEGLEGPAALVGFDPTTGAQRWARSLGQHSTPAAQGEIAALIDDHGLALGIDLSSGTARWCHDLGAEDEHRSSIDGSRLVAAGEVFAGLTSDGHITAIDPATGEPRWEVSVEAKRAADGVSLVGGDAIYLINAVLAAAADTGSTTAPTPRTSPTHPVLTALDPRSGAVLDPVPLVIPTPPSAVGELAETHTYSENRQEHGIGITDPGTGSLRWTKVVPGFRATLIDDTVFVIDQTGGSGEYPTGYDRANVRTVLTAYDAADGAVRWHVRLPGSPQEVFPAPGQVLVSNGPEVFAIDRGTGAINWSASHGSPGLTGDYSVQGSYQWFTVDPGTGTIVGLIVAEEPYRD